VEKATKRKSPNVPAHTPRAPIAASRAYGLSFSSARFTKRFLWAQSS